MNLQTAKRIFNRLESTVYPWEDEDGEAVQLPVFDVRLDAGIDHTTDERDYRLFIRVGKGAPTDELPDFGIKVIEVAKEEGAIPTFENNGIALS